MSGASQYFTANDYAENTVLSANFAVGQASCWFWLQMDDNTPAGLMSAVSHPNTVSSNGMDWRCDTSGNMYFFISTTGGADFTTNISVPDTNWHFYMGVYDAPDITEWLDDSEATGSAGSGASTILHGSGDVSLGRFSSSFPNYLSGQLAWAGAARQALTVAERDEIRWNPMSAFAICGANLVYLYPLIGGDMVDLSGNGNTLTNNGSVADAAGPPVHLGAPVFAFGPTAAPAGLSIPIAAYHYNHSLRA